MEFCYDTLAECDKEGNCLAQCYVTTEQRSLDLSSGLTDAQVRDASVEM